MALPDAYVTSEVAHACPCGHPTGGDYACLNGCIYGPCGHPNCYGACDDTWGVCKSLPGCCDEEDD